MRYEDCVTPVDLYLKHGSVWAAADEWRLLEGGWLNYRYLLTGGDLAKDEARRESARKATERYIMRRGSKGGPDTPQGRARRAVSMAVWRGTITRGLCQQRDQSPCKGRIEAHHHKGYDPEFWYDVTWLCHSHHKAEDAAPTGEFLPYTPDWSRAKRPPEHTTTIPDGWKACTRCRLPKPLTEFYGDKRRSDGAMSACKSCFKNIARA